MKELWEEERKLCVIFLIIFLLFVICFFISFKETCHKGTQIFEYEDLSGNIGNATSCKYTDKKGYSDYSGGMGQLVCFSNGKVIAVKWYEDKTEYGNCF